MRMISLRTSVLIASVLTTRALFSTDYTWTGSVDSDWNTAGNWSPGSGPPGSGDTAIFNNPGTITVSLSSPSQINTINSSDPSGQGVEIAGSTLTVDNGGTILCSSGSLALTAPVALLSGASTSLTINTMDGGGVFMDSGISGGNPASSPNTITAGGNISFAAPGPNTYTGQTLLTSGVFSLLGTAPVIPGDLQMTGSSSVTASVTNAFASTSNIFMNTSGSFNMVSHNQTIATLTLDSGTFSGGVSTLTLIGPSSPGPSLTIQGGHTINARLSFAGATSTANNDIVFDASVAGTATLSQTVALGSTRSFDIGHNSSNTVDMLLSNTITGGAGVGLNKYGPGVLRLTHANTYAGPTTVNAGTLSITTDSNLGASNILNLAGGSLQANGTSSLSTTAINLTGAASIDTNGNDFTIASQISGAGSLDKISTGNLILSGATNSIGGSTTISAGRLSVNGTLTSTGGVTVATGATLGGTGTITANVTASGTISPGNSIGQLDIVGNVIQAAGSTLDVEIVPPPGTSDLLHITGSYTIQPGATLLIEPAVGVYPSSFTVTVVDANPSSLSGTFSNVVVTLPTFQAEVIYDSLLGDVVITQITTVPFSTVISGGNAGAVATCLDALSAPSGSDAELVIAELRQISTIEELKDALLLLQPSQFTALALAQENTMLYASDSIFYRLRQTTEICPVRCKSKTPKECPKEKKLGYWITPYGGFASQKEKNEQPGFNTLAGGVTSGFDVSPSTHWTVGGALGYSYDHLKWREGFGHANIQDGFGALYLGYMSKYAYLFGAALGSYDHYKTYRNIEIGQDLVVEIDRTAKGSHNGWHASGHLQGGLLFGKKAQFSPFVQANYLYIHENSFTEHGAESLNLHVHKKNSDLLEGEAGFEVTRCFSSATNGFSPFAGFSVIREWRFTGKHYRSSFKGSSCVMKTTGMNPDRTLYSPVAGLTFLLPNENCTLSFEYKGKFGEKFHDNRFLAQFLFRF